MGTLFALAKEFGEMPIEEIEKLLESPIHEVRAGAVSIMDKASRNKKISKERLKDFLICICAVMIVSIIGIFVILVVCI